MKVDFFDSSDSVITASQVLVLLPQVLLIITMGLVDWNKVGLIWFDLNDSAINCLQNMTCYVLCGKLNHSHSLIPR